MRSPDDVKLWAGAGLFVALVLFLGGGIYGSALIGAATLSSPPQGAADLDAAERAGGAAAAAPFTGVSRGCSEPDPTTEGGCLTPSMAWLYKQLTGRFGPVTAACWDRHAWNPTSDHPLGRACDISIGRAGTFPAAADRSHGWEVATWLRANAAALHVSYVIWDGQIWSAARDEQGWRRYTGGGIYDASTATGGHFDHVHVSTTD